MPANTRIQLRRGTAAEWVSTNSVLAAGEIGYETDTGRIKIGIDGIIAWDGLDYAAVVPSGFLAGSGLSVSVAADGSTVTYSLSDPTIQVADITDFGSGVSGLLPVKDIVAGSGISVSATTGTYTISLSDPTIQSTDITDFIDAVNDRVDDLLTAGSGIQLSYTDNGNNTSTLQIAVTGIALAGHTHTSSDITDFNSSVSGLLPTVANSGDNRLVTSTGTSTGLNGESNATFDGTTLAITGAITVDNLSLDGNTISSTNVHGDIDITPNGTGDINLNADTIRIGDSNTNVTLTTNGTGKLTLTTNGLTGNGNVQVGANGDTVTIGSGTNNSNIIVTGGANGNVTIDTNGTGVTIIKSTTLYVGDGGSAGTITSDGPINLLLNAAGGGAGNASVNIAYGTGGNVDITAGTTGVIKLNSDVTTSANLTVGGNLIVNGSTTTINSTITTIDDPIFTLGGDTAPGSDDNKDRGIEFRYYNGSAKVGFFGYDDSTGKFTFIADATNSSEVFSGTTGEIDAKIDWSNINSKPDPVIAVDITGDVAGSGNLTMTDLAGGTISISTTVQANSVALGTDTTGNYVASITNGNYITGGNGGSEGAALTLAVDATDANTASKVVARDSSGNFSAGTITATLSGTATNATNIEVDVSSSNINPIVFVNGTDGNLKPSVNNNLRFDAANNELLGDDATTPTTKLKYFVIDGGTP